MKNEKIRSSDSHKSNEFIVPPWGKLYNSNLVFCVMSCIDIFHSSERLERSQLFFFANLYVVNASILGKEYNPFFFFSATADCEAGSYRASPLGATDESNLNQDLVLKTSQEYVQILKKNYMI